MSLPLFYLAQKYTGEQQITLPEESSKHIAQVLRMAKGSRLHLTDGAGARLTATITDDNRKKCVVKVDEHEHIAFTYPAYAIAISPLKNNARFDWFIEKAAELGVSEIYPIICSRTEKQQLKIPRLQNILVSAMLQSQQYWLPVLHNPVSFKKFVSEKHDAKLFIAQCEPPSVTHPKSFLSAEGIARKNIMCIGPEGDFDIQEIELAYAAGFAPVNLGNTRLRTETAGVFAAAAFKQSILLRP